MGVLPPQRRRHSFSLAASVSLQRHIRLAEPAVTFDFCGSASYFGECNTHYKVALQALSSCLDRLWLCSTCPRAGRFPYGPYPTSVSPSAPLGSCHVAWRFPRLLSTCMVDVGCSVFARLPR